MFKAFPFSLSGFQRRPGKSQPPLAGQAAFLPTTTTSIAAEDQFTMPMGERKNFIQF
jgi:hypothetical protein